MYIQFIQGNKYFILQITIYILLIARNIGRYI